VLSDRLYLSMEKAQVTSQHCCHV